jgi:hypothetical protein
MKNVYFENFYIILLSFLCLFLFIYLLNNFKEGFEMPSLSSTDSVSSSSLDNSEEYKYLEPLPENNRWKPETVEKMYEHVKQVQPNNSQDLASYTETLNKSGFQQFASDEEANIFLKTGQYPYDGYVTKLINNMFAEIKNLSEEDKQKQIENIHKNAPNRAIFAFLSYSILPQNVILQSLQNNGLTMSNNKILKCGYVKEGTAVPNPDGSVSTETISSSGYYPLVNGNITLDNNIFKNIQGFEFIDPPCNICQIPQMNILATKDCRFSINTPQAYNIATSKPKLGTADISSSVEKNTSSSSWI